MKLEIREYLPLTIGLIAIGILLLLSLFFAFGPIITIMGVVVGAVISFVSQFWTQRLALKRDYSIKAIEHVYSPLYGVIIEVEKVLERKDYRNWSFGHWDSCQKDYRYFMVDETFREQLDSFDKDMKSRADAIHKLETIIIPRILKETAKEVFPEKPNPERSIGFQINLYKKHELVESYPVDFNLHLKKQNSLDAIVDYAINSKNLKKENLDEACTKLSFWKAKNPLDPFREGLEKKGDYSLSQYTCISEVKNEEFWNGCLKKVESSEEHQFAIKENDVLLAKAKEIKNELIKHIEKPWKV